MALLIPLVMRGFGLTGISIMWDSIKVIMGGVSDAPFTGLVTPVLANLSQGFPLLVEVFDQAERGPVMYDVPFGYIWRSFSPTVSFIDNFSTEWVQYNPRVNEFTPFNTIAELYGINPFFSLFYIGVIYASLILLCRSLFGANNRGLLFAVGVLALTLLSLTQMHQYQTRTFMRIIYMAYLVCFIGWVWCSSGASGGIPGKRFVTKIR
ncbi:MAG: hypothetical protein JF609_05360 [Verrucomicrobia bacterium]|nr:hypothetical protein [Verrucomicrobiota bacterium]